MKEKFEVSVIFQNIYAMTLNLFNIKIQILHTS